ncbi:4'-phosphopantetheinyl transferase family protein [Burkholderia alba]|uniref:4'-phosphopantetheinyl transferase family protein n=1 Tax=Burkholderia alba TaxID=2683677 RepID=UPI002B057044|nr:4'-phosphopantetheinyl transferase superfamily protein [Burkholderia alba]
MVELRFTEARPSDALMHRAMQGEVQVWRAHLDEAGSYLKRDCLSLSEHERAARMRWSAHRELFVFARSMLRVVLGAYLDVDPVRLVFDVEAGGKPVLFGRDLQFSLSHANGGVLLAITGNRRVGCDLESVERRVDLDVLASASLTQAERDDFGRTTLSARKAWLLQMWTRKEAVLKAQGVGIGRDPRELAVRWPVVAPAYGECVDGAQRWAVLDVALGPQWLASVAMEREAADVRCFCLGW